MQVTCIYENEPIQEKGTGTTQEKSLDEYC
jgi:hypothetical protein